MNRNGKIARLPGNIREELNHRLDNNEQSDTLLPWLNDLLPVKLLLALHFEGSPVSKQNLSEWRAGGFLEWQTHQDMRAQAASFRDNAGQLEDTTDGPMSQHLGTVFAARYAVFLSSWNGEVDDEIERKVRVYQNISRTIGELRRADHRAGELVVKEDRAECARIKDDQEIIDRFERWTENPDIQERLCWQWINKYDRTHPLIKNIFGLLPIGAKEPAPPEVPATGTTTSNPLTSPPAPAAETASTTRAADEAAAEEHLKKNVFYKILSEHQAKAASKAEPATGSVPRAARNPEPDSQTESGPVKPTEQPELQSDPETSKNAILHSGELSSAESPKPTVNKEDAATSETTVKPGQTESNQSTQPSPPADPVIQGRSIFDPDPPTVWDFSHPMTIFGPDFPNKK